MKFRKLLPFVLFLGSALCILFGCQKDEAIAIEQNTEAINPADEDLFKVLPNAIRQWMDSTVLDPQSETAESLFSNAAPQEKSITPTLRYYSIKMTGSSSNGMYPFSRTACFAFSPTVKAAGNTNLNNGTNHADVALFTGNPGVGQAGAMWFVSNTALCKLNVKCSNSTSAVDLVQTSWDAKNRRLRITLDGRFYNNAAAGSSILGMLNNFNLTNGAWASPYRIIAGEMLLQFSSDYRQIAGEIRFNGTSTWGSGSLPYFAKFGGSTTNFCNQ